MIVLQILEFIFQDIWHWLGAFLLILPLCLFRFIGDIK